MAPAGHRPAPRGWSGLSSGGTGTAPAGTHPSLARPGPPAEAPFRAGPAPRDGREGSGCEGAGLGWEGSPALTQLASEHTPSTAPMAPPPPPLRFLLPPTAPGLRGRHQPSPCPGRRRRSLAVPQLGGDRPPMRRRDASTRQGEEREGRREQGRGDVVYQHFFRLRQVEGGR